MKSSRKTLFFILGITFLAVLLNFPKNVPVRFKIGNFKVDKILSGSDIDINLGPLKMKRKSEIKYGLDLKGGTYLVLEAEMKDISLSDRNKALESAKNIIERRINFYGVSEPIIQSAKTANDWRLIVELPGVKDVNEAIDLIGKTAQLEFREEATPSGKTATESARLYGPFIAETGLTGKHLKRSEVVFGKNTGQPEVALEFDSEGAGLFEEITRRNVNKQVAIFLDNTILSAPRVNEPITGGRAVITGGFNTDEARKLSIQLNAGALPVPVKVIEQRNIGATLGEESVRKSLTAGLIGFSVVAGFMLFNYGLTGVLADFALLVYALLTFSLFKTIPVTLTLSGIAGFILSIGMAVDANILIFERMKEEIRWGKPKKIALEAGFNRAWTSIRDSNVSSLITSAILYWFGTGSVRGFALTLAIGILVSMFSAITVTRTFLRLVYRF